MFRIQILFCAIAVLWTHAFCGAETKAQGPDSRPVLQRTVNQPHQTVHSSQAVSSGGTSDSLDGAAAGRGNFPDLIVPAGNDQDDTQAATGMTGPMVTTVSSLLVVLAVFGVLVWVSRRYGGKGNVSGALPEDVLRKLGSSSIDGKTRVSFLRIGSRILVVGQTTSGDPQTLTEITDFEEVERITNRCLGRPEIVGRREVHPDSIHSSAVRPVRRDMAAG